MKKLEQIQIPQSEVSLHKKVLKYALLRHYDEEKEKNNPLLRGGDYLVKHKLIMIGATSLFVVMLLFGYAFVGNNAFTPKAEAKEAVEKAFTKFIKLSKEEQANLETKIKADMETSLQEAKNASDLEIVPEEEISRFTPPPEAKGQPMFALKAERAMKVGEGEDVTVERGVAVSGDAVPGVRVADPGKIIAPEGLKVLRYTDPQGKEVILGINSNDEAVMKLIKLEEKDLKNMKVITPENAEEHGFSTSTETAPFGAGVPEGDNLQWKTR